MSFLKPLLVPYKKYAIFSGRTSRKEFWLFGFYYFILALILIFLDVFLGTFDEESGYGLLSGIFTIGSTIPWISITVRRLHDINKSGWWILLSLIPILNIWLLSKKGDLDDNRFGNPPYSVDNKNVLKFIYQKIFAVLYICIFLFLFIWFLLNTSNPDGPKLFSIFILVSSAFFIMKKRKKIIRKKTGWERLFTLMVTIPSLIIFFGCLLFSIIPFDFANRFHEDIVFYFIIILGFPLFIFISSLSLYGLIYGIVWVIKGFKENEKY